MGALPLREYNNIYKALVNHILKLNGKAEPEVILNWIHIAADFAWKSHTGRFADGRIENTALDIGRKLEQISLRQSGDITFDIPEFEKPTRRHLLHVATNISRVGGHTRLVNNWIRNDNDSCHSLLLTNQGPLIPDWLRDTVRKTGGNLMTLPREAPLLHKAKWLRDVARANANMVILHHHPNDIVPVVALATERCPPVAIMDHADHVFWLGSSVADTVINYRDSTKNLSAARRFVKHTTFLPIPLSISALAVSHSEARRQLNLSDEDVMLLSMGRAYKYKPIGEYNFLETAIKILEHNKHAHLYLIGVKWDEKVEYLHEAQHERLHLLGIIEAPILYQVAADLYLEGFPFGSATAVLESAALGVCPVLMFDPIIEYGCSEDIAWTGVIDRAMSEDEYIEKVNDLIENHDKRGRIGKQVKERVLKYHMGREWRHYLRDIYSYLENTLHNPGPIPVSGCVETRNDLVLSRFGELRYGNASVRKAVMGRKALDWASYHLNRHQYRLAMQNIVFALRMKPSLIKAVIRNCQEN